MGGLGGKAALLLAAVAGSPGAGPGPHPGADAAAALRALLQPADLAALVRVALLASHAQDLVGFKGLACQLDFWSAQLRWALGDMAQH